MLLFAFLVLCALVQIVSAVAFARDVVRKREERERRYWDRYGA